MRAGMLRHHLEIERMEETQNTDGSIEKSWEHAAYRWGYVNPKGGSETDGETQQTVEIRIRGFRPLLPTDRIIWGSNIYGIDAIQRVDLEHDEIVATAKRIGKRQ